MTPALFIVVLVGGVVVLLAALGLLWALSERRHRSRPPTAPPAVSPGLQQARTPPPGPVGLPLPRARLLAGAAVLVAAVTVAYHFWPRDVAIDSPTLEADIAAWSQTHLNTGRVTVDCPDSIRGPVGYDFHCFVDDRSGDVIARLVVTIEDKAGKVSWVAG